MKVGIISGYSFHDHLMNEYPRLILNPVSDITGGLKKVSLGMLDVSAIESGKFAMDLSPANLKELIENRIKLHRFSAQAKEIKIAENLQGFPGFKFDKNRITQVLDNLFEMLSNS
jgi:signal transduction histidine kinase